MPKTTSGLSPEKLKELARAGAEQRLTALRAEIEAIERTFPELAPTKAGRAARRSVGGLADNARRMSAAARKAVSVRMKRYWAERRKAEVKSK